MKKFLSLVLALVMTMSLVTLAGAKDFTDASEIEYKEAVAVMSGLKIVDGTTDGAFNPDGTLTRGAAAKIICNLILGPTTAAALQADTAPFADVPANHTFAGYIAYCAQQGIINGYNDGTFRPANGLTGYAFMKMLLGALGYDATVEGYVGANWSVQVAKQALAIGLDDGNDDFNGVQIVTREEALLYAFNAMTATMVDYSSKVEVNTGAGSTVTISGGRYDCTNKLADDYRTVNKDTVEQFCERYFGKLELREAADADAFGRPANTWYNGKTKIGTFAKAADVTYTASQNQKTVYADLDLTDAYDFAVIVDGRDYGYEFDATKKGTGKLSALNADYIGNGSLIEVFKEDGVITVVNTYLAQVEDDYDDDKEQVTIDTNLTEITFPGDATYTLSSDDYAGLEDYKEDDYVLITVAYDADTAKYVVKTITPAEKVTAAITEYTHKVSVTAGEKYEYTAVTDDAHSNTAWTLKKDADLFLNPYGYLLAVKNIKAADQYIFVEEFYKHTTGTRAKSEGYAYFVDGTEAEITISKINGTKVTGTIGGSAGRLSTLDGYTTGWYKFTEKDGKYELTELVENTNRYSNEAVTTALYDYSASHATFDLATDKQANAKTVVLVRNAKDKVAVYTGAKNIPDITGGSNTKVDTAFDGSYVKYMFVDLKNGDISGGSNSTDIVFFLNNKSASNNTDDDNYYTYDAIVNGEKTTIDAEQTAANSALKGLYISIEKNDDGYVVDGGYEAVAGGSYNYPAWTKNYAYLTGETLNAAGVDFKDNTIEVSGSYDFYLADDYTIYTIEGTTVKTISAKYFANYGFQLSDSSYANTIAGVRNSDGEFTALYVYKV